jgi:hypothetical protein
MKARTLWSRILVVVGLVGMLIGAIDPLEGSLIILPGTGIVALGAFVGKSRHRVLLYWAVSLVAVGVGAMFVLTAFGGIGGNTGHTNWWGLVILPYPVGWIMGLAGAILSLVESFKPPGQDRVV